jgi:hypothetical protein
VVATGQDLVTRAIAGDVDAAREYLRAVPVWEWRGYSTLSWFVADAAERDPVGAVRTYAHDEGADACARQYDLAREAEAHREAEAARAYPAAADALAADAARDAARSTMLGEHLPW